MEKTQKIKVTQKLRGSAKILALAICFVILSSLAVTPLHAQLSPARNLSGTWQSSSSGMYYEMDAFGTGIRQADVTGTFAMDITQDGSQITIALYLNPISWVVDPAFTQEYGGITGAPPIAGEIDFSGTVSSSSFTAEETGSQLTSEQLTGTFTTNIITATLSGTAEQTDQNGIVVTLTSSATSAPTQAPTVTAPTSTPTPITSGDLGSVGLVKGSATLTNAAGQTPITSQSQIGAGSEIQIGNNAIVGITANDGTLQLWENSTMVWVGIEQSSSNQQVSLKAVQPPPVPYEAIMSSWEGEGLINEGLGPLGLFVGGASSLAESSVKPIIVDGLLCLLEGTGHFVSSSNSQYDTYNVEPVAVPQGYLVPFPDPEFTVNVANGKTVVQVLDGSVAFLDPVTSNSVIIGPDQTLTLPNQQGFSQQELNADISTLNPNSINHWWTQGSTSAFSLNGLMSQSVMIMIVAVVVVIVVAAIGASVVRKRRVIRQIHASESSAAVPNPQPASPNIPTFKMASAPSPQPAPEQPKLLFCPNCGQKLPLSKKFCPFCGFELKTQDGKQTGG